MNDIELKKKIVNSWFVFLQAQIREQFETIEKNISKTRKTKKFTKRFWRKTGEDEGGGLSLLLNNGSVFDKVGINQSTVSGRFGKQFRSKILGAEKNGNYWASGVSVVAHMKNPKIPALHFNTRYIVTSKSWFGGGMDATPSYKDKKEKNLIHKILKNICIINKKKYPKYKKWCDNYFFVPHLNESRGMGGIFFDYETKNWQKNFKFVRDLGIGFIDISKKVIDRKINFKWTNKEKVKQYYKRGTYVEFNLLYDRGTKFGLNTGGNIESILMSLPPKPKWK